jgi:hypothetical protein
MYWTDKSLWILIGIILIGLKTIHHLAVHHLCKNGAQNITEEKQSKDFCLLGLQVDDAPQD